MQTLHSPSSEPLKPSDSRSLPASLSARWVLRRTGLWLLFVGLGVAGSCLLYMAAGRAEGDSPAVSEQAAVSGKM